MSTLGIDIGGTSVKFGIVSQDGTITERSAPETNGWEDGKGFAQNLLDAIDTYLSNHPTIDEVGIGFPGLLNRERTKVISLPNIKGMDDCPIVDMLTERFPNIRFAIENDAKCAASAEFNFGQHGELTDFALITLGTGVGCGAFINGQLFRGGRGNPTEIGHIPVSTGKKLEDELGHFHLTQYARDNISSYPDSTLSADDLRMKTIAEHARLGDAFSIHVYERIGELLAESIVGLCRILDVNKILLGGGVSAATDLFKPTIFSKLKELLPPYYTDDLVIDVAKMKNDAGILGAAGLFDSVGVPS